MHRPRFKAAEVRKIEAVLGDVDPRLALLLRIQLAQRAGQLLRCWRTQLSMEFSVDGAPSFAIDVPGCGNKAGGNYYLGKDGSPDMLRVLTSGYLSELERRFQETGENYPIFPGGLGRLDPQAVVKIGNYHGMDRSFTTKLMREVERLAGVEHAPGRGFHGFRRRAVDVLLENGATVSELQASGNWSSPQFPMAIYREGVSDRDRRRASELLSGERRQPSSLPSLEAPCQK